MAKKINYLHLAETLEAAANTGNLLFDKVTYEQWLAFLKKHSTLKTITFGRPDPEFVRALRELAGIARDLYASEPPQLSDKSRKLLAKFDKAAQTHGWEKDQGSREDSIEALSAYEKARAALEKHMAKLESSMVAK